MSGWRDALDEQLGLLRFWQSDLGQDYGRGFFGDVVNRRGVDLDFGGVTGLAELLWRQLYVAEPVWVDEGMMDVWEAAAESFPGEPLMPEDLVVPAGFALLPRPFYVRDVNQRRIATRAISWAGLSIREVGHPDRPGMLFAMYTHADDEDDFSDRAEIRLARHRAAAVSKLELVHFAPMPFGEDMGNVAGTDQDWFRWIQSLWRLMGQTLADTKRERLPRAWARRAQKQERDPYVTVIRLRRPRHAPHEDQEPESVDWSHRWIVNGHWRNQWYPSLNAHRQIWISPYCKGPDDKPLKIRKGRAFELVR